MPHHPLLVVVETKPNAQIIIKKSWRLAFRRWTSLTRPETSLTRFEDYCGSERLGGKNRPLRVITGVLFSLSKTRMHY
jgi:hypothetical protein